MGTAFLEAGPVVVEQTGPPIPFPHPTARQFSQGAEYRGLLAAPVGFFTPSQASATPELDVFSVSPAFLLFPLKTILKETLLRVTQVWHERATRWPRH